jgi:uncharacterized membrane protein YeaQ/YmgE (transglycosylase-associated protein family)
MGTYYGMTANGILSAVLIGILMGTLGRLILPGRQSIGAISTVAVGIVAAVLGTWASRALGIDDNAPAQWTIRGHAYTWSWAELGVQLLFAVVGIAIAAALMNTVIADNGRRTRRRTKGRA